MISIIVPVFNAEKYLSYCIDSILQQTYTDFELLLVDDGSSDCSFSICKEYEKKDARIKVFQQENKGQGVARNLGVRKSKGEYISYIDADDYVLPQFLETLYRLIQQYHSDIAVCDFAWIKENQEFKQAEHIKDNVYDKPTDFLQDAVWSIAVSPVNKLIKKELLNTEAYHEQKRHEDEYVIHHILGRANHLTYRNEILYLYVKHITSDVHNETASSYYQGYEGVLDRVHYYDEQKDMKARDYWLNIIQYQLHKAYTNSLDDAEKELYLPVLRQRMRELRRKYLDCIYLFYGDYAQKIRHILGEKHINFEGPLVSIIVAAYNVESFLTNCLVSIRRQTYTNIEVIVVDDGSTDNSGAICDFFMQSDARFKVIHKENGGLSSARNAGIEACTGEYIAFVDGDDAVTETYIEMLLFNLLHKNADISICNYLMCELADTEFKRSPNTVTVIEEPLDCLYKLGNAVAIVVWNKLYKAELFQSVRFEEGKYVEDEFIMHRLYGLAKSVVYTKQKLYYYIQREKSLSRIESGERYHHFYEAICDRLALLEERNHKEALKHWVYDYLNITWKYFQSLQESDSGNKWIPILEEDMKDICGKYSLYKESFPKGILSYLVKGNENETSKE